MTIIKLKLILRKILDILIIPIIQVIILEWNWGGKIIGQPITEIGK